MKVYVVKAPQGEYESYQEPIVKVFIDKSKAELYVKEENSKLPLEQAKNVKIAILSGRTQHKKERLDRVALMEINIIIVKIILSITIFMNYLLKNMRWKNENLCR